MSTWDYPAKNTSTWDYPNQPALAGEIAAGSPIGLLLILTHATTVEGWSYPTKNVSTYSYPNKN